MTNYHTQKVRVLTAERDAIIAERDAAAARADQLEKALRHYAHDHDKWLLRETRFANQALAGVPAEPATEEKP